MQCDRVIELASSVPESTSHTLASSLILSSFRLVSFVSMLREKGEEGGNHVAPQIPRASIIGLTSDSACIVFRHHSRSFIQD